MNKNEKEFQKISEERTNLITELFSRPKKERLLEIEKRLAELEEKYRSMFSD